jgi:DNA-binding Lrp family transcriptional regulator
MDTLRFRLLNDFQRGFPLVPEPFGAIADRLGAGEATVLRLLAELTREGCVSRVGAVLAPRRVGASTLAALSAPAPELSRIAARVSAHSGINHNYEREHRLNLWFVATAADDAALNQLLDNIERETGCRVLSLPLLEEYHIDLGFDLGGGRSPVDRTADAASADRFEPDAGERRLLAALQPGLELVSRPFARLAAESGLGEEAVLEKLRRWQAQGVVKRFGVVVRHRELGFSANAMAVWDVPDERVDAIGRQLASQSGVSLCYRRRRYPPEWPYNLFCMIHGRTRLEVEREICRLRGRYGLHALPGAVLFSRRCFKQQGARYFEAPEPVHG